MSGFSESGGGTPLGAEDFRVSADGGVEFGLQKEPKAISEAEGGQDFTLENLSGVTLDFFLSYHGVSEDARELKKFVDRTDVVALEGAGWTEEYKDLFNLVSQTDRSSSDTNLIVEHFEQNDNGFAAEVLRQIAGTNKPIIFADIPNGDKFSADLEQYKNVQELNKKSYDQFLKGDYEGSINTLKQSDDLSYRIRMNRETFAKKELVRQITELKVSNPELTEKMRVLVVYGSAHRGTLVQDARKSGIPTSLNMNYQLEVQLYDEEIMSRLHLGKDIPEELYARNMFAVSQFNSIKRANPEMNNAQVALLTRKTIDRLTINDIKELSKRVGEIEEPKKNAFINSFLSDKGVIIPNEEVEFRDILGPIYERYVQLGSVRSNKK